MSVCSAKAVLVITKEIEGTSTNVAKTRVELCCGLSSGHAGEHHDTDKDERWDGRPDQRRTLIRHETE